MTVQLFGETHATWPESKTFFCFLRRYCRFLCSVTGFFPTFETRRAIMKSTWLAGEICARPLPTAANLNKQWITEFSMAQVRDAMPTSSWTTGILRLFQGIHSFLYFFEEGTAAAIYDMRRLQYGRCGKLRNKALLAPDCCRSYVRMMVSFRRATRCSDTL